MQTRKAAQAIASHFPRAILHNTTRRPHQHLYRNLQPHTPPSATPQTHPPRRNHHLAPRTPPPYPRLLFPQAIRRRRRQDLCIAGRTPPHQHTCPTARPFLRHHAHWRRHRKPDHRLHPGTPPLPHRLAPRTLPRLPPRHLLHPAHLPHTYLHRLHLPQ